MNHRKPVMLSALLVAAAIGTCAYRGKQQDLGGSASPSSSLPVPHPEPGFVPLHPVDPAPTLVRSTFGLVTSIEQDLDVTWTYEERRDGRHLIDLQLRFKPNQFGYEPQMPAMPDLDPRTRAQDSQEDNSSRSPAPEPPATTKSSAATTIIPAPLTNAWKTTPRSNSTKAPSARSPFSTYLRTFEFVPNPRRDQATPKKVY